MKRAQWGPDAIIGIVILAILALGGVFFVHTFVNGMSVQALLSVADREVDQRCLNILLPTVEGEYVRSGEDIQKDSNLYSTYIYFGGAQKPAFISPNCINKTFELSSKVNELSKYMDENIIIRGGCTSGEYPQVKESGSVLGSCSIDTYNPAGAPGIAYMVMFNR